MAIYTGIGSKTKKIVRLYAGVAGKARKVKKVYAGVDGVAKLVFCEISLLTILEFFADRILLNKSGGMVKFTIKIKNEGMETGMTISELKIKNNTLDTFIDVEDTATANEYTAETTLPANDTGSPIPYEFEVYLNDAPTGMTTIVTVSAADMVVSEFYADKDLLPKSGGSVRFTIKIAV